MCAKAVRIGKFSVSLKGGDCYRRQGSVDHDFLQPASKFPGDVRYFASPCTSLSSLRDYHHTREACKTSLSYLVCRHVSYHHLPIVPVFQRCHACSSSEFMMLRLARSHGTFTRYTGSPLSSVCFRTPKYTYPFAVSYHQRSAPFFTNVVTCGPSMR
jgi:hypothetical protein